VCAVTVDVGGSEAKLRVKPQNTVALAGTRVVLRCATEQQGDGDKITWTFATKNPTCRSKRDHCDLVIDEVQPSDAGAYECSVGNSKIAQASLIVIGKYTNCLAQHSVLFQQCTIDQSVHCVCYFHV